MRVCIVFIKKIICFPYQHKRSEFGGFDSDELIQIPKPYTKPETKMFYMARQCKLFESDAKGGEEVPKLIIVSNYK